MRNFDTRMDAPDVCPIKATEIRPRVVEHIVDGTTYRFTFDPNSYRCSKLAEQLADEWEFRHRRAEPSRFGPQAQRQAMRSFLTHIDASGATVPANMGLEQEAETFLFAFLDWEQKRASEVPSRSTLVKRQAMQVLSLIQQRASRGLSVCPEILVRCQNGSSFGTRQDRHLEEFSRDELKRFVHQARIDIRADRARLTKFRALINDHKEANPAESTFRSIMSKVHENELFAEDLAKLYDSPSDVPLDLGRYAGELGITIRNSGSRKWLNLMNLLQRLLHGSERELVPPLLMLIYKTGLTYDEIRSLKISDITFGSSEITVRSFKRRANEEVVHRFPIISRDRGSSWSTYGLLKYLIWLTQPARDEAPKAQADLLLMTHYVANGHRYTIQATHRKYRLVHWFKDNNLKYSAPANWNRLRKSHHTVRALNSSDPRAARSNHSSEVFESHYLSTKSVLEKSGQSYIGSADIAFQDAISKPHVETVWAAKENASLGKPDMLNALEESRTDSPTDRSVTVGKCSDMHGSPFDDTGLCSEQVRLCMVCPNALILKDHLPQVLILKNHLQEMRKLSDPVHFHNHYSPIFDSIEDVLSKFEDSDLAVARGKVEQGKEFLRIPASMRVAF